MSQSAAAISTTSDSLLRGHRTVPDASSFRTRRLHSRCGRRGFASCRRRRQPAASCSARRALVVRRRRLDLSNQAATRLDANQRGGTTRRMGRQSDSASGQRCDGCRHRREAERGRHRDRIEPTNRVTEVSGRVTNGRGDPSKDYWAIVFDPIAKSGSRRRAIFEPHGQTRTAASKYPACPPATIWPLRSTSSSKAKPMILSFSIGSRTELFVSRLAKMKRRRWI